MKHLLPALCLALVLPSGASANPVGCGGNAYSWTEVIEGRGRRARDVPYVAAPDSYCPEIIEHRPRRIDSIGVQIGDHGAQPPYPRSDEQLGALPSPTGAWSRRGPLLPRGGGGGDPMLSDEGRAPW